VKIADETTIAAKLRSGFRERYGTNARVFRAPGRVNLIGEHTDYNEGFVMPVAIELNVWIAIAPRDDRKLLVHSENFSESAEIDLDDRDPRPRNQWIDYVQGVVMMLEKARSAPASAHRRPSRLPQGSRCSKSREYPSIASNSPNSAAVPKTNSSARASGSWTSSFPAVDTPGTP
jgi:galactokinase